MKILQIGEVLINKEFPPFNEDEIKTTIDTLFNSKDFFTLTGQEADTQEAIDNYKKRLFFTVTITKDIPDIFKPYQINR